MREQIKQALAEAQAAERALDQAVMDVGDDLLPHGPVARALRHLAQTVHTLQAALAQEPAPAPQARPEWGVDF